MKVNGVEVDVHDYDSKNIFEPRVKTKQNRTSSYNERMREFQKHVESTREKSKGTIKINGESIKKMPKPIKWVFGIIIFTQLAPILFSIIIGVIAFIIEMCA